MTVISQSAPDRRRGGGGKAPGAVAPTAAAPRGGRGLGGLGGRVRSWRTVRARLTALYGSLFLVCGASLLAITYWLVAGAPFAGPRNYQPPPVSGNIPIAIGAERHAVLDALLLRSGIALVIMTVIAGLLGWIVAGRVLRPLRTIASTAQRISETNLHERLAFGGPRDELTQLADTMDGLLARLEAAFDAQRRFVANAAHELRTPLTTIRAKLDVAVAKPEGAPPQLRTLDRNVREDLDQADLLLESFLTLARAQHRQLGEQRSMSLARVAAEALASQSEAIAARQIALETAIDPAVVTGSYILLRRMVDNVIENAVRHNQLNGFITVACDMDYDRARLVVESGGPVLDPAAVAQLAQPFTRLGADRTELQNGHGLGLSIVAAVAAAHGGDMDLRARPEGGLRVQISLPAANAAGVAATA
jgi:signal transduction histidine kinase